MLLQALRIISYPLVNSNWSYSPETPNLGQIRRFLEPCDLVIWRMTLQNNRAPLLCYFKLCAHFIAIGEFKLELQSGNAQSGSNSTIFTAVSPWNLTLKFDGWPWKTIGHLFYATSSFVQNFKPIGEFKLSLSMFLVQSSAIITRYNFSQY